MWVFSHLGGYLMYLRNQQRKVIRIITSLFVQFYKVTGTYLHMYLEGHCEQVLRK